MISSPSLPLRCSYAFTTQTLLRCFDTHPYDTLLPNTAQHVSATNRPPTDRRLRRLETHIIPAKRDAVKPGSAISRLLRRGIIRSRKQTCRIVAKNEQSRLLRKRARPRRSFLTNMGGTSGLPISHESSMSEGRLQPVSWTIISAEKGFLVWNIPLFHLVFFKECPERLSLLNRAGASGVGHLAYGCRCQRSRCSFCGNKVHG